MITNNRKYLPSFAEKVDRLNICQMKSIYSSENTEKFEAEIAEILHDIQLDIDEGLEVTAEVIRAIVLLTQANQAIWTNEDKVRTHTNDQSPEETANTLLYTHRMNASRAEFKTRIQNLIGGRTDKKINYSNGEWVINWDLQP